MISHQQGQITGTCRLRFQKYFRVHSQNTEPTHANYKQQTFEQSPRTLFAAHFLKNNTKSNVLRNTSLQCRISGCGLNDSDLFTNCFMTSIRDTLRFMRITKRGFVSYPCSFCNRILAPGPKIRLAEISPPRSNYVGSR